MAHETFEKLTVYQLAEALSDQIWKIVLTWDNFTRDTVGKQLVRAVDGIGANIAAGAGRRSSHDNRRFVRIARGSYNETKHWLRRAYYRKILTAEQAAVLKPLLDGLSPELRAHMKSLGSSPQVPDPSTEDPTPPEA